MLLSHNHNEGKRMRFWVSKWKEPHLTTFEKGTSLKTLRYRNNEHVWSCPKIKEPFFLKMKKSTSKQTSIARGYYRGIPSKSYSET